MKHCERKKINQQALTSVSFHENRGAKYGVDTNKSFDTHTYERARKMEQTTLQEIKDYLREKHNIALTQDNSYNEYFYETATDITLYVYDITDRADFEWLYLFEIYIYVLGNPTFFTFEVKDFFEIDTAVNTINYVSEYLFERTKQ